MPGQLVEVLVGPPARTTPYMLREDVACGLRLQCAEVAVTGARSASDAQIAAKAIANSPLVKGAVRGGVVNWGRIACALGKSAAKVDQDRVTLKIGGVTLFARGRPCKCDLTEARRHVAGEQVRIDCNLGIGKGAFCALTCDLPQ